MSEVYASECCGGLFVPGHGPDDLHDAEKGNRLVLESEIPGGSGNRHSGFPHEERVFYVSERQARVFDAIRAGECPCCGEEVPGLTLLMEVPDGFTEFMPAAQRGGSDE